MMTYQDIEYIVKDHIACITLNRPNRLNAWTRKMGAEVHEAFYSAARDDHVRVIILTGKGRGFCAGAEMAELKADLDLEIETKGMELNAEQLVTRLTGAPTNAELDPGNTFQARPDFRKRHSYLQAIPKPVIAAINGTAAGLGMILPLYCDLRFASDKARFTTAFSRRGLIAEHGVSWLLPRIIGMANAMDLLYSARIIDAREALDMGLINRICPDETLLDNVTAYAAMLSKEVSPRSIKVMKKQLYEAQFQTLDQATQMADKELLLSFESEDLTEGVNHFLEKRPPRFTGK